MTPRNSRQKEELPHHRPPPARYRYGSFLLGATLILIQRCLSAPDPGQHHRHRHDHGRHRQRSQPSPAGRSSWIRKRPQLSAASPAGKRKKSHTKEIHKTSSTEENKQETKTIRRDEPRQDTHKKLNKLNRTTSKGANKKKSINQSLTQSINRLVTKREGQQEGTTRWTRTMAIAVTSKERAAPLRANMLRRLPPFGPLSDNPLHLRPKEAFPRRKRPGSQPLSLREASTSRDTKKQTRIGPNK